MVPKSILASMYRTSAAICYELGEPKATAFYVQQYLNLYLNVFPKTKHLAKKTWRDSRPTKEWSRCESAIYKSGLLDRAPDGVGHSPWGFDEVNGFPNLAPFLSLSHYAWLLYVEGKLEEAAKCFLQLLGARKAAFGHDDNEGPR